MNRDKFLVYCNTKLDPFPQNRDQLLTNKSKVKQNN